MSDTDRGLFRDSTILAAGNIGRSLLQALILVVTARHLPVSEYGLLVAMVSLVAITLPLVGFGYEFELLKCASNNTHTEETWHEFVAITIGSSILLSILLIPVAQFAVSHDFGFLEILMLMTTEVLTIRLAEGANRVHQGYGQVGTITTFRLLLPSARLVALLFFISIAPLSIERYIAASVAASLLSLWILGIHLKRTRDIDTSLRLPVFKRLISQLPTATSFLLDKVIANADKIILAKIDDPKSAAGYSIAQRFTELLSVPMLAVISAIQPRIFGNPKEYRYSISTLAIPLIYIIIIAPLTVLFGDLIVTTALGENYADSAMLINLLLFLPVTTFYKYLLTTIAIAQNKNRNILIASVVSSAFSICANISLIPIYGAIGSALALLLAEVTMIMLLWYMFRKNLG